MDWCKQIDTDTSDAKSKIKWLRLSESDVHNRAWLESAVWTQTKCSFIICDVPLRPKNNKFKIGGMNQSKKSQCVTEVKPAHPKLRRDITKLIFRVLPISQINATATENKQVRGEMKRLSLSASADVLQIWFTAVHAYSSRERFFCGKFHGPCLFQKMKCLRFWQSS